MPRLLFAGVVCIALVALLCSALAGWMPGTSARFPGLFGSAAEADGDGAANAQNAVVAPGVVAGAVSATVGPVDAPLPTSGADVEIRDEVLGAYQSAVALAPRPCRLEVSLLAAIGQVESGNLSGHQLDSDNRPEPAIVGPPLDGSNGLTAVPDTDSGEWDGDTTWDRAVGPLAFIPGAWRLSGVDFDADGERDPQDIEDSSGAAMVFLCASGHDLSSRGGLRSVIWTYNPVPGYVDLVMAWKTAFVAAGLDDAEAEPPELTAVQVAQVTRDVEVSTRRTADALEPSSPGIVPVADPNDPSTPGPSGGPPLTPGKPPPWVKPPPGSTPAPTPPGSTPTPGGPPGGPPLPPPTSPTPSDPPTRPSPTDPDPGLGIPAPPGTPNPGPSDPTPSDPGPSDPPPSDPGPSDPPPPPNDPEPSNPPPPNDPPNDPGPSNPPPPNEPEPSDPPNDPGPSNPPPPNDPEPSDPPSSPAPTSSPNPPPPNDPEPSNPGPTSSPDPTSDPGPTSSPGSPSPSGSTSPSASETARVE